MQNGQKLVIKWSKFMTAEAVIQEVMQAFLKGTPRQQPQANLQEPKFNQEQQQPPQTCKTGI